jgi:hypothetical protein
MDCYKTDTSQIFRSCFERVEVLIAVKIRKRSKITDYSYRFEISLLPYLPTQNKKLTSLRIVR